MMTNAPRVSLPQDRHHDREARYRQLIELTKELTPIRTAGAHPVDCHVPAGARGAAHADVIAPTFVGPEAKMRAAASRADTVLARIASCAVALVAARRGPV
jgi:phosphate acetyltransferase/phosphate butyryltransferase